MVSLIDQYVIEKVKEKRIENGYSQAKLAFELNQEAGFIGKIESGKYGKKYNVSHLNDIALILGCSPRDFLPKQPLAHSK